jgi:hypothetical protein
MATGGTRGRGRITADRRSFIGTAVALGGAGLAGARAEAQRGRLQTRPLKPGKRATGPLSIKEGVLRRTRVSAPAGEPELAGSPMERPMQTIQPSTRTRLLTALAQAPGGAEILEAHGLDPAEVRRPMAAPVSAELRAAAEDNLLAKAYIEGVTLTPVAIEYADPAITSVGSLSTTGHETIPMIYIARLAYRDSGEDLEKLSQECAFYAYECNEGAHSFLIGISTPRSPSGRLGYILEYCPRVFHETLISGTQLEWTRTSDDTSLTYVELPYTHPPGLPPHELVFRAERGWFWFRWLNVIAI